MLFSTAAGHVPRHTCHPQLLPRFPRWASGGAPVVLWRANVSRKRRCTCEDRFPAKACMQRCTAPIKSACGSLGSLQDRWGRCGSNAGGGSVRVEGLRLVDAGGHMLCLVASMARRSRDCKPNAVSYGLSVAYNSSSVQNVNLADQLRQAGISSNLLSASCGPPSQ